MSINLIEEIVESSIDKKPTTVRDLVFAALTERSLELIESIADEIRGVDEDMTDEEVEQILESMTDDEIDDLVESLSEEEIDSILEEMAEVDEEVLNELSEGDLSYDTLYNKFAGYEGTDDVERGARGAKAVLKAIRKVHGNAAARHAQAASAANARAEFGREEYHVNKGRNASGNRDVIGATVGRGRSAIRKRVTEEEELNELSGATLGSYIQKAHKFISDHRAKEKAYNHRAKEDELGRKKAINKHIGIMRSINRLNHNRLTESELNELSRATLGSYIDKARPEIVQLRRVYNTSGDENTRTRALNKINRRKWGVSTAAEKFLSKPSSLELNELSKKTLGSYVGKAAKSLSSRAYKLGSKDAERTAITRSLNNLPLGSLAPTDHENIYNNSGTDWRSIDKLHKSASKRLTGIERASKRLSEEELNELSKKTLGSYVKKAIVDKEKRANSVYNSGGVTTNVDGEQEISGSTKAFKNVSRKQANRSKGIDKALDRLAEGQHLDELSKD